MSTQDKVPTFAQARHTLDLIEEAELNRAGVNTLHSGYLSAFLKAVKEDRLPGLSDFTMMLHKPVMEFKTWAKLSLGDGASGACLLSRAEEGFIDIRHDREYHSNDLMGALSETGIRIQSPSLLVDVVLATPLELGGDPWLFDGMRVPSETLRQYVCRKAYENGLMLFSNEALLRFCLDGGAPDGEYEVIAASQFAIGSTINWRDFVSISRSKEGQFKMKFTGQVLRPDAKIMFLR